MNDIKACPYCDAKRPRKLCNDKVGDYPMGKPLAINEDGYIVISHHGPCKAFPQQDEWHINLSLFGVGIYSKIDYCPKCGRDLKGDGDNVQLG